MDKETELLLAQHKEIVDRRNETIRQKEQQRLIQ